MATSQEKRETAKSLMLSRKAKNIYTQSRPVYFWGYPSAGKEPGRSDCSGSVGEVLKRAAGLSIGGNTSAQIDNRKNGIIVDQTTGFYPDESKLKVGDCLYFKGNTAHSMDVGHVEMYIGNGQCIGHNGGMGPTLKNMRDYCKGRATAKRRYFMAIRWIKDDGTEKPQKLGDRPLSRGMVATDVGELQRLLIKLKHNIGTYGPGKDGADDDYGALTAKAVKAEQKKRGLAQTGDADLVTIEAVIAAANNAPVPTTKQRVRITGGTVNVRTGPSTKYKILGVVKSGSTYAAMGSSYAGWYGIQYGGKQGYVSAKYSVIAK